MIKVFRVAVAKQGTLGRHKGTEPFKERKERSFADSEIRERRLAQSMAFRLDTEQGGPGGTGWGGGRAGGEPVMQ